MHGIVKQIFRKFILAMTIIAGLDASSLFAQLKPGILTQFTEQDGLPGIQVNKILQDKFGYKWVGTNNGFARYDSFEFKRFYNNPNDSISFTDHDIPQKLLDNIFQPFFTTKPTGEGTQLGLSLSYDNVKAHGGELRVNTKEGEGSEFMIELPIQTLNA